MHLIASAAAFASKIVPIRSGKEIFYWFIWRPSNPLPPTPLPAGIPPIDVRKKEKFIKILTGESSWQSSPKEGRTSYGSLAGGCAAARVSHQILCSLSGPLYFGPKCRKHAYKVYHHNRDCTIPACKPYNHFFCASAPSERRSLTHVQTCHLAPRFQKMRTAPHTAGRQPAVHRGIAHCR